MRRSLAALAVAAFSLHFAVQTAAAQEPIFTDSGRMVAATDLPSARRVSLITIDHRALVAARTAASDTLELDLLGLPAALNINRVERRPNGATSVFARIDSSPDSQAVITIVADAVSARLDHPDLGTFVIEPTGMRSAQGQRLHHLIEIDPTAFAPCALDEANLQRPNLPVAPTPRGLSVVDQMIVYTPAVRNTLGGHDGAIAFCQNAVDLTNQNYLDSEINNLVLNLVHVQEVSYTESGNTSTDLQRLRVPSDGFMDEIPVTIRNAVAADNIAMIVNSASNACGTAASINPVNANLAFSVSVRNCAIGNLTFPHEIGHTMGCSHDRAVTNFGWFPYSFGHVFTISGGATRRTIMATSSGSRIARFSNPDVTFSGGVTGVPIGSPQAAHNAETHRQTGSIMADHRASLGCTAFALTADPLDTDICAGATLSLSVGAFESVPGSISLQWRFNALPIPGATTETLDIPNAQSADSGLYDCVITSDCLSITSQPALVSITSPVFVLSPQSQLANPGDTVTFTANFSAAAAQLFWAKDGQFILDGLGSDTLVLNNVSQDDAGVYVCRANTPCGITDSDPATLTIAGAGCSPADLAEPFATLDFSDVIAFLSAFAASDPAADLSSPLGVFDFSDVLAFLTAFAAGCP